MAVPWPSTCSGGRRSFWRISTWARAAARRVPAPDHRSHRDHCLWEDTAAIIGVCLALAGLALHQVTGSAVPDALASIAIGLLLVVVAVRLASRERELLTNQSASPSVVSTIRELLEAAPGVSVVPRLEVLVIGPRTVLVTAEVGLNDSVTGEQVTRLVAELRDRLRGQAGVAQVYLTPSRHERPWSGR